MRSERIAANHARAAALGAVGTFSEEEWYERCAAADYRCVDCGVRQGERFPRSEKVMVLTIGHAYPLSRGGSNWIANVLPQCLPCNDAQGTKLHRSLPESEAEENEFRKKITVRLTRDQWEVLRRYCLLKDTTFQDVIIDAVATKLAAEGLAKLTDYALPPPALRAGRAV